MLISYKVARALVSVCDEAGLVGEDISAESLESRAQNLLKETPYGVYIAEGDPHGWARGDALATIYMEQKGHKGDCGVPLNYYGDGTEVAYRASELMGDLYIEFVNAAVACVYAVPEHN
tara:strand:- start:158 stop:514 length:357 start_codon:yes stop_codon:yes gene_type:complete